MTFIDQREFIDELEKRGMLKRINAEVDCELEITEIADRVSKLFGEKNVALLFENVKGYDFPVLINAFGSMERIALALGVKKVDDIADDLRQILRLPYISLNNKMDLLKIIPKARKAINFPRYVKSDPCKEVIIKDQPSLAKFPILRCWPGDAGQFITLPQNGAENFRAAQEQGSRRIEVAVALGGDPTLTYAAIAPLPRDIDEMVFAGFLRGKPVELVKCETVDIEVPAHAEIILEGYVDQAELRREGSFSDHTGYYSLADDYPVFHITCITHRKNSIYLATVVGKPPMENCYMAKATEWIFLLFLQVSLPEIIDVNLPLEGVFHNCAVVSIKKSYPQQAKKVMQALWRMGQMMFTKMIIVVDEHVNVQDMSEVWWRVFNNIDARRDIVLADGPLDVLDHSSPMPNWGTKVGIDATKPWP